MLIPILCFTVMERRIFAIHSCLWFMEKRDDFDFDEFQKVMEMCLKEDTLAFLEEVETWSPNGVLRPRSVSRFAANLL